MFDIIGDIHGHADALEILLQKLNYVRMNGVYTHPENRKVLFVGDFIDRGPKIRETLHIVKDMYDAGNAIAIMGNHEFNAICFHTLCKNLGGYYRNHSIKEIEQHLETIRQFKYFPSEWKMFLNWFKQLPLFFENEDFGAVHACWVPSHIQWIKENYNGITEDFLELATSKANTGGAYKVIEDTLKGTESALPSGRTFVDKDGTLRKESRIRWWNDIREREKYGQFLFDCPKDLEYESIPDDADFYFYNEPKKVFFGHYWLKGIPTENNANAICLDYSVAKGGILVACRTEKHDTVLKMSFVF